MPVPKLKDIWEWVIVALNLYGKKHHRNSSESLKYHQIEYSSSYFTKQREKDYIHFYFFFFLEFLIYMTQKLNLSKAQGKGIYQVTFFDILQVWYMY